VERLAANGRKLATLQSGGATLDSLFANYRPNASFDDFRLKRKVVELLKSYRMMCLCVQNN
jgi:hypothetical protein